MKNAFGVFKNVSMLLPNNGGAVKIYAHSGGRGR